eukprot:CAMPEP_0177641354 /NCGR_PEP_ID=MMETSP0447-20121125/7021_1 /TAXON_ID=0 /ORGANISM="Stygamoeba regulata, Strain BSH-02190019" /LENGTH=356 /DNA_ID=CAMNT_0019143465 /DNA_START=118 /DNA_END=1188 /DNA_ORIENTATION=+
MGTCGTKVDTSSPEFQADRAIDKKIREDKKAALYEAKILMLGAGESGKSTIVKQFRILFLKGFSDEDRIAYKSVIFYNCLMGMRQLLLGCLKLGLHTSTQIEEHVDLFISGRLLMNSEELVTISESTIEAIVAVWKDKSVQEAYTRRNEFQLTDSLDFFFNHIREIGAPNFMPGDDFILKARTQTTGIIETVFEVNALRFRVVDVGGQRGERRKWIHCFDAVTALIFCTALSEYDQTLAEDENVNRMGESLTLFEEICGCTWFQSTPIMLFLNKSDLFAEKIKKGNMHEYFSDYTGGADFNKGVKYIREKFEAQNQNPSRTIYPHVTCALDTKNIQFVFQAVRHSINVLSINMSMK